MWECRSTKLEGCLNLMLRLHTKFIFILIWVCHILDDIFHFLFSDPSTQIARKSLRKPRLRKIHDRDRWRPHLKFSKLEISFLQVSTYLIFKKSVLFRPNRVQQIKLNLESQIYFSWYRFIERGWWIGFLKFLTEK